MQSKSLLLIFFILVILFLIFFAYRASIKKKQSTAATQSNTLDSEPFLMPIEDVFSIQGRGVVVTGTIQRGRIHVGDKPSLVGRSNEVREVNVTGIEQFRKLFDEAAAGDPVGLLLRHVTPDEVKPGQVLAAPNSIDAHERFSAEVYFLSMDEGGLSTPITADIDSQFFFRAPPIDGSFSFSEGILEALPGETTTIKVTLSEPLAMEIGSRFSLQVQNKVIASGTVIGC